MSAVERVVFEQVSKTARATGRCAVCGKSVTRSKKLWQTVNPFNKLPDGTVKSAADIRRELDVEARRWQPDFRHAACAAEVGR